jgi:flagellar assembly factor FliW
VYWLQSLDNPDVLFSVTDPGRLGIRYEVLLSDDEIASLALARPEDAMVLLIVYREVDSKETNPLLAQLRANVRSPLIINLASLRGMQKLNLECDIVFRNT